MFRLTCLTLLIPTLLAAAPATQPAPLELTLTYQNANGRMMGQPPEMKYGEGFMLVQVKWPTAFTEKDEVYYRAWIAGPADWASANTPKADDKFRQYAYTGRAKEGKRSGVNFKLELGFRPEGLSGHPESKLARLDDCDPLPPGKHAFTVHIERVGPGEQRETASASFEVAVKGDASTVALWGIGDGQVFQRKNAKVGDIVFRPNISVPATTVMLGDKVIADQPVKNRVEVPVGGPYTVKIEAEGTTKVFKDIYVGDVWIVSGQSNAVGCGYEKELYRGPMPGVQGLNPKYGVYEWAVAKDGFFESTMGPWVTAAQKFYAETKVPVGLIGHAVGSKPIDFFYENDDAYFLRPIIERYGQGAAAFFWYQGESDAFRPETRDTYGPKLAGLVKAVRTIAGNDKMQAGIVQLARYTWQRDDHFAAIRETQRQFVLGDPNAVLYSTMPYDVAKTDKIHLTSPGQFALGNQIADQMIARERSGKSKPAGPVLKDVTRDGNRVIVSFAHAAGLKGNPSADEWYVTDDKRAGFRQGGFVPIDAIAIDAEKQQVVLTLKETPAGPIQVSYGYRADIGGSLTDDQDHPAPCFVKVPVK
jgi:hypothetical protein